MGSGAEVKDPGEQELYNELWSQMFDADIRRNYYRELTDHINKCEFRIQVFQAILSSSAIASWTIWTQYPLNIVWPILLGLNTILAIIHPFLNLQESAKRSSEKLGEYTALYTACFSNYRRFKDGNTREGYSIEGVLKKRDENHDAKISIEKTEVGAQHANIANKVYNELREEYRHRS